MQITEVAYELADSARFITGSAQIESFLGLPYRGLMWLLNAGRFDGVEKDVSGSASADDEPCLLARMIPKLYKETMNPKWGVQGRSAPDAIRTLMSSSIEAQSFKLQFARSLDALGLALSDYIRENPLRDMDL